MSKPSVVPSRPAGKDSVRASLQSNPPCVDLAERFGRRFRVEYEESYAAQYGRDARVYDPWLQIIPCRAGQIYPWGESTLAASTDKAGPIARKLAALPGTTLWQDGNDGATVLFDAKDFEAVAQIMHPQRRRRLSPERKAKLVEAGANHRFTSGVQKRPEPHPCVQIALCSSEAVQTRSAVSDARGAPVKYKNRPERQKTGRLQSQLPQYGTSGPTATTHPNIETSSTQGVSSDENDSNNPR